jgi:glycosyltransferase involved in cell wall biosynthesis
MYPVLLMARELDSGGSERQLTEIALGLDRERFEPYIGTFRPDGLRGGELRAAGVPVVHFPVYSFRSAGAVAGAWKLARFIRGRRVRLVHAFDAPLSVFATPVVRYLTSAAMLTSQRGDRSLTPEYRRWLRWTDRRVDGLVVNCQYLRRYLIEEERVREELIEVCLNGIDLERFRSDRSLTVAAQWRASTFVIGVVAMLRPEKDLGTLIKSFALIRGLRAEMKLVVVGSGSELEPLQRCAREAGVGEDCLWQPATADVAAWLRTFDVFVLPSLSEAFPNALMEAMACGCAIVASNVGGIPELVQDGETGLLFDPGRPEALAGALRRLIEDPQLRARLAAAGERYVREHLSRRVATERMGEIYTAVIEGRRRSEAEALGAG